MTEAFRLPKMSVENLIRNDKAWVIKDMLDSTHLLTTYRTKTGESRCLFTGLGEEEFKLCLAQFNRYIPLYEFYKSIIQNIDCGRLGEVEQQKHMMEAIKYFILKNQTL